MKHARDDYDHIQDLSGKIPDNEPVFLLRAQDRLAAGTVAHYAALLATHGLQDNHIHAVLRQAAAMAAWPTKKMPDCPIHPNSHPW